MLRNEYNDKTLPGYDSLQQGHLGVVRPHKDGAGQVTWQGLGVGNGRDLMSDPEYGATGG